MKITKTNKNQNIKITKTLKNKITIEIYKKKHNKNIYENNESN